jgi:pyrroloquinoline quinone biosynthesis protein E
VLQVHFSGGEPMARRELGALIAAANERGLYSNLITSGALGGERELVAFAAAGLRHVQLSFQDHDRNATASPAAGRMPQTLRAPRAARPAAHAQHGGASQNSTACRA